MQVGKRKPLPDHVPSYLPPYPDCHTFIKTPVRPVVCHWPAVLTALTLGNSTGVQETTEWLQDVTREVGRLQEKRWAGAVKVWLTGLSVIHCVDWKVMRIFSRFAARTKPSVPLTSTGILSAAMSELKISQLWLIPLTFKPSFFYSSGVTRSEPSTIQECSN